MALFTVNNSNVFGNYLDEAGKYNVKILPSSKMTHTNNSDKPMMQLNFEVLDGDHQGAQINYANLVWDDNGQDHLNMSIRRFNTLAVAVGVQEGAQIESLQQLLNNIIGKHLSVATEWRQSDYNNKYYLTVTSYGKPLPNGSQPNGQMRPNDDQQQNAAANVQPSGLPTMNDQKTNNDSGDIHADQLPF